MGADHMSLDERAQADIERVKKAAGREPDPPNVWTPGEHDRFTYDELAQEPDPTRYIVFPYITEECAAVLVGAGGTSKTGVLTLLSVHIATGAPFFGGRVEQGAVLFVTAEDRRKVLHKHVWAHARDLPPPLRMRLAENFILKDVVGLGVKLSRRIDGETVVAPDVSSLIEYARSIPNLKLVVLDTLSRLNGGDEMTDGLAAIISAMEAIARATGAATIIAHHTGKAQHRDGVADQYTSRGGSALSDNARSVMLVQVVGPKDKEAPSNAGELIAHNRLLRPSHVKANDIQASPRHLQRIPTPHRAQIAPFAAEFAGDSMTSAWQKLAVWMREQKEIPYPTARTVEGVEAIGSRDVRRQIVTWAMDRGLLLEVPHPHPHGRRKTYLVLADGAIGGALEAAA